MPSTLRVPRAEEMPAFWRCAEDVFAENANDLDLEVELTVLEPGRSLVAEDDGEIVATASIFSRQLTVPGAVVPMAGVTYVTVRPTHRRQGLLTAMLTRQFADVHASAEAVAGLWASESVIYQRFGYGNAAGLAVQSGPTRSLAFRPGTDLGVGRLRRVDRDAILRVAPPVYDAIAATRPGFLDRDERWWKRRYSDHEHHRRGATELRFVVHEDPHGRVTGWAAYRIKADSQVHAPDYELGVIDLHATDPSTTAALWRHLLDHDLVRRVRRWSAPVDDPVYHLLADPRALTMDVIDSLWIRLVDVDRALAARRYRVPVDVVLEVADPWCPWNVGRWRLRGDPAGATCVPTQEPAQVSLSVTELGAAYLGGRSLLELAAAGRVTGHDPAALAAASVAFGWDPAPWCPEVF